MTELWCWRHPRCEGARGRCIGRTDVAVDRRRAKRLAHRIHTAARRAGLPRTVHSSPLARCAAVARVLRRWGWRVVLDARWSELDFGRWEGQSWTAIDPAEVAAWEADFLHHAPGGGESLASMRARVSEAVTAHASNSQPLLLIAHAGVMQLLALWAVAAQEAPSASTWPPAQPHGRLRRFALQAPSSTGDPHA
jgi:alpha-ribazole phosphatase